MRRLLVVAYYFPPMGLSGVQRVAKFVKYLPAYGWQAEVLTVEPAGYFAYDETLLEEVRQAGVTIHRTRSWDPTRLFGGRQTVSLPAEPSRRLFAWLSSLLFVPDNKVGWMPHALRAGRRLLQRGRFDALFSSAPPYTAHLVAARLSRSSGLPLVVDFRDDWVGNPRHVYPTPLHRGVHQWLERYVLQTAHHTLAINATIVDALAARNPGLGKAALSVLPQGFDPADFEGVYDRGEGEKMRLLYTGVFYDAQTPDPFLRALAGLVEASPALRSQLEASFVGLLPEASRRLIERLGLTDLIRYEGYLPHDETVARQRAADVLWLTIGRRPGAQGISTSKLFEYMGARKPILALVPEGAAREALRPYGAATVAAPDDEAAITEALGALLAHWQAGTLPQPDEAYVRRFDRKVLAGRLARRLNEGLEAA